MTRRLPIFLTTITIILFALVSAAAQTIRERSVVNPSQDTPIFRLALAAVLQNKLDPVKAALFHCEATGSPEYRTFRIKSALFVDPESTKRGLQAFQEDAAFSRVLFESGFRTIVFVGPNKEWEIDVGRPTTQLSSSSVTLGIEAGIIYLNGGMQPVARTEFVLLDEDPERLFCRAGLSCDQSRIAFETYGMSMIHRDTHELIGNATAEISKHTVASTITDFGGKAIFKNVPSRKFWLFGIAQTRRGCAVWSIPMDIEGQDSSIVLDQHNARVAK
jgi:hypothetical protein